MQTISNYIYRLQHFTYNFPDTQPCYTIIGPVLEIENKLELHTTLYQMTKFWTGHWDILKIFAEDKITLTEKLKLVL